MSHETTMYSYDHGNTEVRGVAGEMLSVRAPTSDWAQAEDTAQHSTSPQHWASIHTQNTTNTAMTAPASNIRGILNIDSNSVISTVLLCFKKPLLLLGIVWYLHNHLANILNIIL